MLNTKISRRTNAPVFYYKIMQLCWKDKLVLQIKMKQTRVPEFSRILPYLSIPVTLGHITVSVFEIREALQ